MGNSMILWGWQCFYFLLKIRWDLDERYTLTLEWQGTDTNTFSWWIWSDEPEILINAFVNRLEKIGVGSESKRYEWKRIREEDVTPAALNRTHIDHVLEMIGF